MQSGDVEHVLRFGYLQQLVALGALLGFNLLVPAITGLDTFGRFTAAHGLVMLIIGLAGSGLDLVLAREIRGANGGLRRDVFWRSFALRLASCTAGTMLALAPGSPLEEVPESSGISVVLITATVLSIAVSSHCIAVVIGAMAARQATMLSALHALPYFALPLLQWWLEGAGPASLMKGVLWSYLGIIVVEILVLRRLAWSVADPPQRLAAVARAAVVASPNSVFETTRVWGTVLLASLWLTPTDLGVARTSFSIATAMVSCTPVPMQAMVALGARLEEAYHRSDRLATILRHASILAALAATLATIVYGGLMPGRVAETYTACAAGVLLLTAVGPIGRLSLSVATARTTPSSTATIVGCALFAALLGGAGSFAIGPTGLLIGTAIASLPLATILPATLRRRIAPAGSVAFVLLAAAAVAGAAMASSHWLLPAGLVVMLLVGYGVSNAGQLRSLLRGREHDQGAGG